MPGHFCWTDERRSKRSQTSLCPDMDGISGLERTAGHCSFCEYFPVMAKQNCHIGKYSSTSYVEMGWVQNGVLYLRYRNDFVIMKAEHSKAFMHK